MMNALQTLVDELKRREPEGERLYYRVPGLWRPLGSTQEIHPTHVSVNPYHFYRHHIEEILATPLPTPPARTWERPGDWIRDARIYNMFVRLTAAYDHDADGTLGSPDAADRAGRTLNAQGVRETGTFLKAIALLGHIRSLGCDTVHLLPITAVGEFGNKGNLGSPYAIRNPYKLEPTLADPLLDADADTQFAAFVEACHRLGMRVVVEFVFRTSSRDGDWIGEHPEWFYWIRREIADRPAGVAQDDPNFYGVPPFDAATLEVIKAKVAAGDLNDLPAPPQWYRELFTAPPAAPTKEADGRWSGTSPEGVAAHVPSAFADWPPDDQQPPWTDVTYLRVYQDPPQGPNFNYIAYNTIRMYDERLARPENAVRDLWNAVDGIIPNYQRKYGIDGVMVDMGHALPHELMHEIIASARKDAPDFALLSENFSVGADSLDTGYNAVLGYQFSASESAAQMRELITRTCLEGLPIAALGTAETHNTPRTAMRNRGASFCRTVWLLNNFLPDTIPFVHGGFELADEAPVNLGLRFTAQEMKDLAGVTLGLFDVAALDWDDAGDLPEELAAISALRDRYRDVARARGEGSFVWLDAGSDDVLAFMRPPLAFILNWNTEKPVIFDVKLPDGRYSDLAGGGILEASAGALHGTLAPGEGIVLAPVAAPVPAQ